MHHIDFIILETSMFIGRWGHTGTMNTLYLLLNLFKDDVTMNISVKNSNEKRKWRMSKILPMSGNLMFVKKSINNKNYVSLSKPE